MTKTRKSFYIYTASGGARAQLYGPAQDGSEDMEAGSGSWPLQNIQMANSLKIKGYDFHFSFGTGTHNHAQNNSEMPEVLAWLWRDYDPAKTQQTFEQDATEKAKPFFRVRVYNRD